MSVFKTRTSGKSWPDSFFSGEVLLLQLYPKHFNSEYRERTIEIGKCKAKGQISKCKEKVYDHGVSSNEYDFVRTWHHEL